MSQPAGIENNGGQGPVGINGSTASGDGAVTYGQLGNQQQYQQPPQQFQQQAPQGGNPPYQEYLNRFPESLRGTAEPIFRDWDAQTTQRFQQLNQQLEQYQPYQEFTNYDPQGLQMAVQLAQLMQSNPEQLFQYLANELNYDVEGDDAEDVSYYQGNNPQELQQDERWNAMQQALSELTELVQGDRQEREEDAETEQILGQLNNVEQQRGPLDYEYVLNKAYATGDLNGAVEEFYQRYGQAYAQQVQQQNPQQYANGNGQQPMVEVGGIMVPANHPAAQQQGPPQPLASGGGLPSEQKDLGSLSPKERIALVAQTLNAANQAGQG